MTEKKSKSINFDSCSKEYVKYYEKGQERQAARAMYEYFNTAKYIKQIQASM